MNTFWKVCINIIKTYLEDNYNVIFNYIIAPKDIDFLKDSLKNINIKFIVLLVDEKTLLERDKNRPEDCQMNERCKVLLKQFQEYYSKSKYVLDTTNLSINETIEKIKNNNKFILE